MPRKDIILSLRGFAIKKVSGYLSLQKTTASPADEKDHVQVPLRKIHSSIFENDYCT